MPWLKATKPEQGNNVDSVLTKRIAKNMPAVIVKIYDGQRVIQHKLGFSVKIGLDTEALKYVDNLLLIRDPIQKLAFDSDDILNSQMSILGISVYSYT